MYYKGLIITVSTFLIIGLFHPVVVEVGYKWGIRPRWIFLVMDILSVIASLFVGGAMFSSLPSILDASYLRTIRELFSQKKRVEKGWFPMNPKQKDQYDIINPNER